MKLPRPEVGSRSRHPPSTPHHARRHTHDRRQAGGCALVPPQERRTAAPTSAACILASAPSRRWARSSPPRSTGPRLLVRALAASSARAAPSPRPRTARRATEVRQPHPPSASPPPRRLRRGDATSLVVIKHLPGRGARALPCRLLLLRHGPRLRRLHGPSAQHAAPTRTATHAPQLRRLRPCLSARRRPRLNHTRPPRGTRRCPVPPIPLRAHPLRREAIRLQPLAPSVSSPAPTHGPLARVKRNLTTLHRHPDRAFTTIGSPYGRVQPARAQADAMDVIAQSIANNCAPSIAPGSIALHRALHAPTRLARGCLITVPASARLLWAPADTRLAASEQPRPPPPYASEGSPRPPRPAATRRQRSCRSSSLGDLAAPSHHR